MQIQIQPVPRVIYLPSAHDGLDYDARRGAVAAAAVAALIAAGHQARMYPKNSEGGRGYSDLPASIAVRIEVDGKGRHISWARGPKGSSVERVTCD